jgi:aryl-alcohol dehydrogenase-like predicted oxidoreductase
MKYDLLGTSDLLVSELCLGAMAFGEESERGIPATEARIVPYSQVALAWLRVQPAVSSVIIGVRTMAHLEDNLGALEIDLTADELARLDAASALPKLYPYRFRENYQRAL